MCVYIQLELTSHFQMLNIKRIFKNLKNTGKNTTLQPIFIVLAFAKISNKQVFRQQNFSPYNLSSTVSQKSLIIFTVQK